MIICVVCCLLQVLVIPKMRELIEMMMGRSQEPCMQIICMYIYIEQESKIQKLCGAWSMGKT